MRSAALDCSGVLQPYSINITSIDKHNQYTDIYHLLNMYICQWEPVRFGEIKRSEATELGAKISEVGIGFFNAKDLKDTLKELRFQYEVGETQLVVASCSFFAYKPVLRALQLMPCVPFAKELVYHQPSPFLELSPQYSLYMKTLKKKHPSSEEADMARRVASLDWSQQTALNNALSQRLALIQGPPGTGKTHIGVMLSEIILAATECTILCICYTNHALDSFLEGLMSAGVTGIVRMGGQSKSEKLSAFNLSRLVAPENTNQHQANRRRRLKKMISVAENGLVELQKSEVFKISDSWVNMEKFIIDKPECVEQLMLPANWSCGKDQAVYDEEGFQIKGISGKNCLWVNWCAGKPPPKVFENRASGYLWELSKEERQLKRIGWRETEVNEDIDGICKAIQELIALKNELFDIYTHRQLSILRGARVIGCTTTGAAMSKSVLDSVATDVVLVEEAAEIMEAHVLTGISKGCKHLVMIGDHEQLRPKAEYYRLTVESGKGYDLNVSLFERLAKVPSLRPCTLQVQHRMHPDISAIPKLRTYPQLQDAPITTDPIARPLPLGVTSRVNFIQHTRPEDRDPTADRADSVSKTNTHEVNMCVATVQVSLGFGV